MSSQLQWHCLTFNQLTTEQLYQLLKLRADVFVVEQKCAYLDPDNLDLNHCWHLFTFDPTNIEMAAYCRIIKPGVVYPGSAIGRVVVAKSLRAKGYGQALMQEALAFCRQQWLDDAIELSAQCQWEGFYRNLGFTPQGESYLEDGIPHIHMMLKN